MRCLSVLTLAVLVVATLLAGGEAKAQGLKNLGKAVQNAVKKVDSGLKNFDEARLDAMSLDHRAGRDFTKLYVQNKTNRRLLVAIHYYNSLTDPNATYLERPTWHSGGWWELEPGENFHIANANGANYYVAVAEKNGTHWSGEINLKDPRQERSVPFSMYNFGGRIVPSAILHLTD